MFKFSSFFIFHASCFILYIRQCPLPNMVLYTIITKLIEIFQKFCCKIKTINTLKILE